MRNRPAFTLLELLVVITIGMIVIKIALPSMNTWRYNAEVRGAADRYREKHSLAQAVAVRKRRISRLVVNTATRSMWVEVERSSSARDTVGDVDSLDSRIGFSSDRTILCFDARGLAKSGGTCESPNVTSVFTAAGRADTIRTSVTGRILR